MRKNVLAWLFLKLVCSRGMVGEDISPEPEETIEPADAEPSEPTEQEEGAEPSEVEEPAEKPAPKENRVQKRIDEITREKHEARQEAEYWRKVATGEIKPPAQQAPVQQEALPPGLPPRPKLDDFDDYDQYTEAIGEWAAEKILATREFVAQQKKANEAKQTVVNTYQSRVEAAREKYADWDEVIATADVKVTDVTLEAILESEQGPDISYHLLSNPAEAARINALSQVQQIKEIARLESKFAKPTSAPVKRVTQAPQPINAVDGAGDGAVDMDKLSDDEWIKAERARLAKSGRRY